MYTYVLVILSFADLKICLQYGSYIFRVILVHFYCEFHELCICKPATNTYEVKCIAFQEKEVNKLVGGNG